MSASNRLHFMFIGRMAHCRVLCSETLRALGSWVVSFLVFLFLRSRGDRLSLLRVTPLGLVLSSSAAATSSFSSGPLKAPLVRMRPRRSSPHGFDGAGGGSFVSGASEGLVRTRLFF